MEVIKINDDLINSAKDFLLSLPKINKIDDEVLKNASIIIDNEVIKGVVSYEPFRNYGLIRYFIFKNDVIDTSISSLLDSLAETAASNNVEYLFSIIADDDIYELFQKLGFSDADKNYFYIDEESILDTKYKNAYIMIKRIA